MYIMNVKMKYKNVHSYLRSRFHSPDYRRAQVNLQCLNVDGETTLCPSQNRGIT